MGTAQGGTSCGVIRGACPVWVSASPPRHPDTPTSRHRLAMLLGFKEINSWLQGGKNTPLLLHQCTLRYFGSFSHSSQSGYWLSCHCQLWIVGYNVSVWGRDTARSVPGFTFPKTRYIIKRAGVGHRKGKEFKYIYKILRGLAAE